MLLENYYLQIFSGSFYLKQILLYLNFILNKKLVPENMNSFEESFLNINDFFYLVSIGSV